MFSVIALAAIGFIASSCKVGPNYEAPQNLPAELWSQPASGPVTNAEPDLKEWWTGFNDPVLSQLIAQAQESNASLEKSLANVRVAMAALGVTESEYWPSISTAIEYSRNKTNVAFLAAQGVETTPYDVWAGGAMMANWEIDVWGRVARLVESSRAALEATVEDLRGVLISIRAEVGTTYMEVRTMQAEIVILNNSIANYRSTLELARRKFEAGTNTMLDVNQAQSKLDLLQAKLPELEANLASATFALAQLCGTTPGPMTFLLAKTAPIPSGRTSVGVGIPAELLRRRPDVRASERRVAAAVANIGAAEALNLPVFSLQGNLYLASNQFSGLGNANNLAYGFGPTVSWLVFQGGYVNSLIAQSKGQAQLALASYRDTVLGAIRDAETSISSLVQAQRSVELYQTAVDSSQSTYDLAMLQYKAGTTTLDRLLEVQNNLFQAQQSLATSQGTLASNLVGLYRALGGGWDDGSVNQAAQQAAGMKGST